MNETIFPDPKITSLVQDELEGFLGLKTKSMELGLKPVLNARFCRFQFQVGLTTLRFSLFERSWSNVYGLSMLVDTFIRI